MRLTKMHRLLMTSKQHLRYLTTILEENGFTDIQAAFDGVKAWKRLRPSDPATTSSTSACPRKRHYGL